MALQNYTVTREFNPADLIPGETMTEFGEKKMQREFASAFAASHACIHEIDGWTVSVTVRTDDPETVAIARVNAMLDSVPAEMMKEFA